MSERDQCMACRTTAVEEKCPDLIEGREFLVAEFSEQLDVLSASRQCSRIALHPCTISGVARYKILGAAGTHAHRC